MNQEDTRRAAADETTVSLSEEDLLAIQTSCMVDVGAYTHIGTRAYQQDAYFHSLPVPWAEGAYVFGILCDGMGGMTHGEQAALETVRLMAERLARCTPGENIPAVLLNAAHEANRQVVDTVGGDEPGSAGTTLVTAVIAGDALHWLSIGDSRLYILRGTEMVQVTRDHNLMLRLMEQVKRGEMPLEEAQANPHREALLSFIGIPDLELWDVNHNAFSLLPGDTALLCSDGLTKAMPDEEIRLRLQDAVDMREAAEQLVCAALTRDSAPKDNTTVLLMRYLGHGK